MTSSERRWFRFSLRTLLLIVTAVGIWLGWNLQVVNRRKDVLVDIERRGAVIWREKLPNREISFIRYWLGDWPISQIEPPKDGTLEEDEELRALFPEAYVYYRVTPEANQ